MTFTAGWRDHATPGRVGGAAGGVAGAVMLAPWLQPGALLVRDLVAISDPAWSTRILLASSRLPRDIPGETLAAIAGQVVPADLVVRLALLLAVVGLGAGAARLGAGAMRPGTARDASLAAAAITGVVAVWNPWVWSRLHQGQWLVVIALATLPWALVHLVDGERWRLARTMVVAGLTGFPAFVVVVPALLLVGVVLRRWRGLLAGLAVSGMMALPYLVVTTSFAPDPDGFAAFAPSADVPAGVAASLLSAGGYFNTAVAADWRGTVGIAAVATALAVAAVVGAGLWRIDRRSFADQTARTAVLAAGATALVLVALSATEGGQTWLATRGTGWRWLALFRDSHRLLAPWVVVLAIGAGHLTRLAVRRWSGGTSIAVMGIAIVVLTLPDPLVGTRLPPPSDLPDGWRRAADMVQTASTPGAVLVVPHGQTQAYPFTNGHPVHVPLRRMVTREVLVDTRLVIDRHDAPPLVVDDTTGGERARDLARRMDTSDGRAFADAGISHVAITDPSRFLDTPPRGMGIALRTPTIQLLALDHVDAIEPVPEPRWPLLVDLVVATAAVGLLGSGLATRARRAPRDD